MQMKSPAHCQTWSRSTTSAGNQGLARYTTSKGSHCADSASARASQRSTLYGRTAISAIERMEPTSPASRAISGIGLWPDRERRRKVRRTTTEVHAEERNLLALPGGADTGPRQPV